MGQTPGDLRQTKNWWLWQTHGLSSVLLQLSKRSATDLYGRNDGNLKVIFPDVAMEDVTNPGLRVQAQPGDYVLVKVRYPFALLTYTVKWVLDWIIWGNEIFLWRNSLVK